jgi:hypothetical protein
LINSAMLNFPPMLHTEKQIAPPFPHKPGKFLQ